MPRVSWTRPRSRFDPDAFAIEVAQEQQINANKAAAAQAQTTANSGVQQAQTAQVVR